VTGLERLPSNRMRQYVRAWINEWDLLRLDPSYEPDIESAELEVDLSEEPELEAIEQTVADTDHELFGDEAVALLAEGGRDELSSVELGLEGHPPL
jgi:hypothetical protein